jgi:hypothetical protein
MPFLKDPRGLAATGLVLGLAAAALAGSAILAPGRWHRITLVVGTITLGLGVATVWVETIELLLAAFMSGIAVTYALAEVVHAEEPATASVTPGGLALGYADEADQQPTGQVRVSRSATPRT